LADKEIEQQKKESIADIKQTAKEAVKDVKSTAKESSSSLKEQAKESEKDIKSVAKDSISDIKAETKRDIKKLKEVSKEAQSEIKESSKEAQKEIESTAEEAKADIDLERKLFIDDFKDARKDLTDTAKQTVDTVKTISEDIEKKLEKASDDLEALAKAASDKLEESTEKTNKQFDDVLNKLKKGKKETKDGEENKGKEDSISNDKILDQILKEVTVIRKLVQSKKGGNQQGGKNLIEEGKQKTKDLLKNLKGKFAGGKQAVKEGVGKKVAGIAEGTIGEAQAAGEGVLSSIAKMALRVGAILRIASLALNPVALAVGGTLLLGGALAWLFGGKKKEDKTPTEPTATQQPTPAATEPTPVADQPQAEQTPTAGPSASVASDMTETDPDMMGLFKSIMGKAAEYRKNNPQQGVEPNNPVEPPGYTPEPRQQPVQEQKPNAVPSAAAPAQQPAATAQSAPAATSTAAVTPTTDYGKDAETSKRGALTFVKRSLGILPDKDGYLDMKNGEKKLSEDEVRQRIAAAGKDPDKVLGLLNEKEKKGKIDLTSGNLNTITGGAIGGGGGNAPSEGSAPSVPAPTMEAPTPSSGASVTGGSEAVAAAQQEAPADSVSTLQTETTTEPKVPKVAQQIPEIYDQRSDFMRFEKFNPGMVVLDRIRAAL
jgi:hypothetical protein